MATKVTAPSYDETVDDIESTIGHVPGFMQGIPEDDLVAEWPSFKKYNLEETEIPAKYRELIGLAVAANIRCPYCQEFHLGAAEMNGATEAELAEVASIASQTARWSAMLHAQHYDEETFSEEFAAIGEYLQDQQAAD